MKAKPKFLRLALWALPLTLAACAGGPYGGGRYAGGPMMGGGMMHGPAFVAPMVATQGNSASGVVMFHDAGAQVIVHARLSGLKPDAEHGFHVHEKGDCSSADGTSAGGHWNPSGKPHGPQGSDRHAGDMPNLRSDAQGRVDQHLVLQGIPGAELGGKAVIVHANADDYRTQPTGNSGGRIACGVIARR